MPRCSDVWFKEYLPASGISGKILVMARKVFCQGLKEFGPGEKI